MDFVKLGRTGLDVSRLCLGCMSYGEPDRSNHAWTLPEEESLPFIRKALDLGINFFDTAKSNGFGTGPRIGAQEGPLCRIADAPRPHDRAAGGGAVMRL